MKKLTRATRATRTVAALVAGSALLLTACTDDGDNGTAGTTATTQTTTTTEARGNDSAGESDHPAGSPIADDEMRVTLLGTGSPVPNEDRYGMSTLVQAGGLNLVFDAGRGVPVRLQQAGVPIGETDAVFITHFHSDHVNGLNDLWLTGFVPAFGGREGTFDVYGPTGVENLVDGLRQAYRDDIEVRVADGEVDRATTEILAYEFAEEGVIFEQDGVTVTMFEVQHDPADVITPAMGYRVDYAGRSVLISGDTIPHENVIEYGTGVDLLIHEVAEFEDITALPEVYSHHTNPREAGEIFATTQPRLAVYSHIVNGSHGRVPGVSDEELVNRTRENYDGPLIVGEDLMSFLLNDDDIDVHERR